MTRRLLLENAELLASFPPQVEQVLALLLSASPRPALKREELSWAVPDYLLSALPESSAIVCELAGHLMAATVKEGIEASIVSALLAQSLTGECTVESLKSKFNALSRVVLQALLKQLEESGALERRDEKLYAPGTLAKEKSQALQAEDPNETKILAVLAQHPCLELDELARQVDLDSKKLKGYLDVLGRKGKTELVNYEFVATRERILSAHELLSRLWQSKRDISPADFRDGLATSRKYALALLAYFDDHQITRRLNTGRVLLKGPPNQVRTTNQR